MEKFPGVALNLAQVSQETRLEDSEDIIRWSRVVYKAMITHGA